MESKALREKAFTTPEARLRRIQRGCGIIEKVLIVLIIWLGVQLLVMIGMAMNEYVLQFMVDTFGNASYPSMLGYRGIGQISEELAKGAFQKLVLWMACETAVVMVFFILLCDIASVTKKSETPFLTKNARRLQQTGWVYLALGILSPIMRRITLETGFQMIDAPVSDPSTIFMAGILLVLAKIFEYGCMLQQEYDETL